MRILWNTVGFSSLAAGLAGAVLPLLPATPFFILAAYAFSRGSPKVESWLLGHPRWGPVILDWRRERAISKKALARKTGARGLRSILEHILLDTMFELPSLKNVQKVVIDDGSVTGDVKPILLYADPPKVAGSAAS
jgi:uncharacterized membrane protein YbaN (DUF454 family)